MDDIFSALAGKDVVGFTVFSAEMNQGELSGRFPDVLQSAEIRIVGVLACAHTISSFSVNKLIKVDDLSF
jgi:hypothetical protein